jgi:DNA polymerase zeta
MRGKTREQAFKIGREISAKVTGENPPPMELELEKVYQPCMMVSKKR